MNHGMYNLLNRQGARSRGLLDTGSLIRQNAGRRPMGSPIPTGLLATTAAGFLPGAGLAELPQTTESLGNAYDNIAQGNYGQGIVDATYGVLGGVEAAGDATMLAGAAFPPLMAVGAMAKGIGRAGKIASSPYISRLSKAVANLPQEKMSGQQASAMLAKTPGGVSADEMEFSGIKGLLGQDTVTKTQLMDQVEANPLEITDVVKRKPGTGISNNDIEAFNGTDYNIELSSEDGVTIEFATPENSRWGGGNVEASAFLMDPDITPEMRAVAQRHLNQEAQPLNEEAYIRSLEDLSRNDLVEEYSNLLNVDRATAIQAVENDNAIPDLHELYAERGTDNPQGTMHEEYTLPGGKNYQEVELTLPSNIKQSNNFRTQAHTNTDNVLAHYRSNERVMNGENTLFIEEIQSDWHQAGRKKGYKGETPEPTPEQVIETFKLSPDLWSNMGASQREMYIDEYKSRTPSGSGVPDAPYKKNWDDLTFRRALHDAVSKDMNQIGWTDGQTQGDRYPGDEKRTAGMKKFYDEMLVNRAKKIGKKYGVKPELVDGPVMGKKDRHTKVRDYRDQLEAMNTDPGALVEELSNVFDMSYNASLSRVNTDFDSVVNDLASQMNTLLKTQGSKAWTMKITPEMKADMLGTSGQSKGSGILKGGVALGATGLAVKSGLLAEPEQKPQQQSQGLL